MPAPILTPLQPREHNNRLANQIRAALKHMVQYRFVMPEGQRCSFCLESLNSGRAPSPAHCRRHIATLHITKSFLRSLGISERRIDEIARPVSAGDSWRFHETVKAIGEMIYNRARDRDDPVEIRRGFYTPSGRVFWNTGNEFPYTQD